MAVDSTGKIFTMADSNTETFKSLLTQLASLLATTADLEDICVSGNAKLWAKFKSFNSQYVYDNSAARETAREECFFGISINSAVHGDNSFVRLLTFTRDYPSSWKRIRDWDGYDHSAESGVLITAHDTATVNTTITLATNAETNYNVTMRDLLNHSFLNGADNLNELDKFRWVVIDAFGFIHELGSVQYTKSTLMTYLFGSSTKLTVNITNDLAKSNYNLCTAIAAPQVVGKKWTLGLMGWKNNNNRVILNALQFNDARTNTAPVRISGFAPNMSIGTAYMGRTYLREVLYNGVTIQCCSDDYLFMGFTLTNISSSVFDVGKLRFLFINNVTSLEPYSTQVATYNKNAFSYNLSSGGVVGTGGRLGTAWANGMMYIRVTDMWTISPQGFCALAYAGSATNIILLTPYIPIALSNTGKTVDAIADSLKATLPDVKPTGNNWTTIIQ